MARKKKSEGEAAVTNEVEETKEQKLRRLAARRVPIACKRIAYCGNLAAYSPTIAQSAAVVNSLQKAVDEVASRLQSRKTRELAFDLPESVV